MSIGWGERIEYSHVKQASFGISSPKTICGNVKPCIVVGDGGGVVKLLACELLQLWLNTHFRAHFRQQMSGDISDLVVSESGFWAGEGMFDGEGSTTYTLEGEVGGLPSVMESQGISKGALVEDETMFSNGQGGKPGRSTPLLGQGHCELEVRRQV